jgi:hypothetical protein
MPGSYNKKRKVGWVKTDASSNILPFSMEGNSRDRRVLWDEIGHDDVLVLSAGSSTSWTTITNGANSIPDWVPPGVRRVYLEAYATYPTASVQYLMIRKDANGAASPANNAFHVFCGATSLYIAIHGTVSMWMTTDSNRDCEYKVTNAGVDANIRVRGYEIGL